MTPERQMVSVATMTAVALVALAAWLVMTWFFLWPRGQPMSPDAGFW